MSTNDIETLVVGGGIAGLACASHLKLSGRSVRLVERNDHLGGVIRTLNESGYRIETGPNSLYLRPEDPLLEILFKTGLDHRILFAGSTGKKRFILKDGRPIPLPLTFLEGLTSPVLSLGGKIRVLKEPFVPPFEMDPGSGDQSETVSGFVERRFGQEFLDWIVDPFIKGVFASTPEILAMEDTFPKLVSMEDAYGSIIKAALAMQFGKKSPKTPLTRQIFSFDQGMGCLPTAIADLLGTDAGTNAEVVGCTQTPDGFRTALLFDDETYYLRSRHVVLASSAIHSAEILQDLSPGAVNALGEIPYAPIAVVAVGYARKNVAHPLDGFGLLIPTKERRKILGILFSSSLFEGRAPEGQVLLTVFVGGMSNPKLAFSFDEDLIEMIENELKSILGTKSRPDFLRIQRWEGAIPQYTQGHRNRITRALTDLPKGIHLAGSYLSGVSVSQSFTSGINAAHEILKFPPEK